MTETKNSDLIQLLKYSGRISEYCTQQGTVAHSSLFFYLAKSVEIGFLTEDQISYVLKRITRILDENLCSANEIVEAFSQGQILSKNWLVKECVIRNLELGTVFLCCGWFGSLFLNKSLSYKKIRSFDVDPKCYRISHCLLHSILTDQWRFLATTQDIHTLSYDDFSYQTITNEGTTQTLTESADTIINTSCEHVANFDKWYEKIPIGKLLILQSNDGFSIPGHVNCSKDLSDFEKLTPLNKVLFSGQMELPKFKRFMRIGYK